MTDDDFKSFWSWLKALYREERGFFWAYLGLSLTFATLIGIWTFCLLYTVR